VSRITAAFAADRSMGVSPMTVVGAEGMVLAVHPPEPTVSTTILVLLTGHGRDAHATVGGRRGCFD
jgi:hypothetical protein